MNLLSRPKRARMTVRLQLVRLRPRCLGVLPMLPFSAALFCCDAFTAGWQAGPSCCLLAAWRPVQQAADAQ